MLGAEPVVPGFARIAAHEEQSVPAGEVLLGELNCLACHQADEAIAKRIPSKAAPDLSEVGGRVTPQYLRKFLFDTHAAKPGTPMPNLFHGVAPQQREEEVEELAHYLSSLGGPVERSKRGGNERLVERGRELYHSVGCVACHAPESGADKLKSPVVPLGDLASKTTVDKLSEFLLDPLKIRKSGRMPSLWLGENEARAIAVYLLREQLKAPGAEAVAAKKEFGVEWQYFEAPMGDKLPDFDQLTPTSTSATPPGRQKQDRWVDAAIHWEQVAEIRALEPTGLQKLADVQIRLERYDDARASLEKLLAKNWPSRFANVHRDARKKLVGLEKKAS